MTPAATILLNDPHAARVHVGASMPLTGMRAGSKSASGFRAHIARSQDALLRVRLRVLRMCYLTRRLLRVSTSCMLCCRTLVSVLYSGGAENAMSSEVAFAFTCFSYSPLIFCSL